MNFGGELNGSSRVARRILRCIALLVALLFVLDFSGATATFWQQHPVTTSLLTGAILSLGLAVGFEHVLARREELSRRPLGQAACHALKGAMWAEETLDAYVLDYCARTYGRPEVPVDKSYPDEIVLEALSEEETWAATDGAPDLLEAITQDQRTLQEEFARWAPIFVAAPELSDAADCATEVMRATSYIAVALNLLAAALIFDPALRVQRKKDGESMLIDALRYYQVMLRRFHALVERYETEATMMAKGRLAARRARCRRRAS